jgi:NADH dehydrogenase (ubiquinone) Fe-S protein 3
MVIIKSLKRLSKICPVYKIQIKNHFITLLVKPSNLINQLIFFKNHINSQFYVLTCVTGVDYPSNNCRFQVIYELLSVRYNTRIRIKVFTSEIKSIDSCQKVFSVAKWYESEVWDMFGVFFKNHSDLKRLLTDYGFKGYPLRKDFPLSGFVEAKYHSEKKKVVTRSLELSQEYRDFKLSSPWESLFLYF